MANILGIQTVDNVNIISVDVNPSLGLGTPSPTGSFAIAVDGSGFFYKNGASDTNWILSVLAPYLGVARYVYLVQDSTDVTKLGGTTNNVYSTFQAAYDAANALQVALGGTNKVVVMVGNTTSATVGNLVLAANWNQYVSLVGVSSAASVVGTISSTTFSVTSTFVNITVGNITTTSGGTITLTLLNSITGNLLTSTSTAVATGNITVQNSFNSTIGTITASSSLGNIGSLTFTTCSNVIIGAVSMTQTSTIASFSISALTMTSCNSCTFGSTTTITMAYASSTGNIAGIVIGNTNTNILFIGNVVCTGFITSGTASNVFVNQITLNNCDFNGTYFAINGAAVSSSDKRGGYINTVTINKCTFASRVRFYYNAVSTFITGINFNINDCIFKSASAITGVVIDNYSVSFTSLLFSNCVCNDLNYGLYVTNAVGTPTVPFMVDGNSIQFVNCDSVVGTQIYNPSTPNTVDDVVIKNCNGQFLVFSISEGDANMNVYNSGFYDIQFYSSSSAAITKQQIITNSNIGANTIMQFVTPTTFVLKNSHFDIYTDVLNPYAFDVIAYNSFIESKADAGSTITYTGTLYTSTLKKLATDNVAGLTNNNSYIF